MKIRTAEAKDTEKILDLLSQVLELHAAIRPDIFIPGTTKYTHEELAEMFTDENRRIYVAADENDNVIGYAFCEIRQNRRENMVPFKSFYIDDFCVDAAARGSHVGQTLFEHVKREAAAMGCYEISLNVWSGNDTARKFYDKMGFTEKSATMEYILQ